MLFYIYPIVATLRTSIYCTVLVALEKVDPFAVSTFYVSVLSILIKVCFMFYVCNSFQGKPGERGDPGSSGVPGMPVSSAACSLFSCTVETRIKEPTFLGNSLLKDLIFSLYNPYIRDWGKCEFDKNMQGLYYSVI